MADRAAGDIPEVRMTLTQRLRRVEVLAYRFSEMLDLLISSPTVTLTRPTSFAHSGTRSGN